MYGVNPFAAQNASNGQSSSGWGSNGQVPSIFGALPYPSGTPHNSLQELFTLKFTSFAPTIINCKVVGPHSETYFRVVTDASTHGRTVLKNSKGTNIAVIEWQEHPYVEMTGAVSKQPIRNWLKLSTQRSHRLMVHQGVSYSWTPNDRFIQLHVSGSPDPLVRVSRTYDSVIVEMTPRAIQLGLIEVATLATILLQCGKNID
ncbi:hypothetical protein BJ138DRAFT_1009534 [Hygrophoropsis aurantiaca]|uniref:Uncharacterized protein n=1 Tax=Hygrophoropsis aurantiaca TaxID=72124 RepID=A0ACB8AAP2_9AGAM|nr:hypothetical protein BJ138DRAFT_1009534 [Hygrophoropsis aurantiaca]